MQINRLKQQGLQILKLLNDRPNWKFLINNIPNLIDLVIVADAKLFCN